MENTSKIRPDGRNFDQLRPLRITYDPFGYAESSVLFELGDTKVLCAVNLQQGVPPFLRGKNTGWLSAEYAMLPTATQVRKQREIATLKKNGRSVEIARLIGRCLRTITNLSGLGERTITVDCDVLQADGGTRTACITGAYIALRRAVNFWMQRGLVRDDIIKTAVAAISLGVKNDQLLLDLDYAEDSSCDADFNIILTQQGDIVEVQGTAERVPISWHTMQKLGELAHKGVQDIFVEILNKDTTCTKKVSSKKSPLSSSSSSLFSLKNRLNNVEQSS